MKTRDATATCGRERSDIHIILTYNFTLNADNSVITVLYVVSSEIDGSNMRYISTYIFLHFCSTYHN